MMIQRKVDYYFNIARTVGEESTCLRAKYGAIIVKNDEIISTGYSGAPRGRSHCTDLKYCRRQKLSIPRGERYELCRSIHAEQNAIISASRRDMIGSDLFLVGSTPDGDDISEVSCCSLCKKFIINAGIKRVYIFLNKDKYQVINVQEWIDNDESLGEHRGY